MFFVYKDVGLSNNQAECQHSMYKDYSNQNTLIDIEEGCMCFQTMCNVLLVNSQNVSLEESSNCISNVVEILGCDFNFSRQMFSQ